MHIQPLDGLLKISDVDFWLDCLLQLLKVSLMPYASLGNLISTFRSLLFFPSLSFPPLLTISNRLVQ